MKEPFVSRMLKISLYAIFALGILGVVTLPLMLDFYAEYFYDAYYPEPSYRSFIIAFLRIAAVFGLLAVHEMILVLRSVPRDPFIARNARALKRIGVILLIMSAMFFIKCFFYSTFLTMCCGFLFIICALFAFTLESLFRQAVAFKEENDLTI